MSVTRVFVGDSGENTDVARATGGKANFVFGDVVSGLPNELAKRLGAEWVTEGEADKRGIDKKTPSETQETQETQETADAENVDTEPEGGDES